MPSTTDKKEIELQNLINEEQEPIYKLIVDLVHKEAETVDNPFVFKEDHFGKTEVKATGTDIQPPFVRGRGDMSRAREIEILF